MDKNYNEKEKKIFNGLIRLIKDGANPYLIKVQEIADAAGIGKGTIYDYFKTKEEAIAGAIVYSINKEIAEAYSRIKNKQGFRAKFDELLAVFVESIKNNLSTINLLLSAGGAQKFYEYLRGDQYDFTGLRAYADEIVRHLLQAGYEEGIIKQPGNRYYEQMAVHGALAGFACFLGRQDFHDRLSLDEAGEMSYTFLLKALN